MQYSLVTVTAAANSFRLTSLAAVNAALGLTDGTTDAFVSASIDRQSAVAEKYCRRFFARQAYSEIFRDVSGAAMLVLKHYPAASIVSVTVDGAALSSGDYEIDGDPGQLYRLSGDARTEWSGSKITVAYTAGYVLPLQTAYGGAQIAAGSRNLPYDIEDAVIALVKEAFYAKDRDPSVRSVDIPGVISEGYALRGVLPGYVEAALAPYRRMIVA